VEYSRSSLLLRMESRVLWKLGVEAEAEAADDAVEILEVVDKWSVRVSVLGLILPL